MFQLLIAHLSIQILSLLLLPLSNAAYLRYGDDYDVIEAIPISGVDAKRNWEDKNVRMWGKRGGAFPRGNYLGNGVWSDSKGTGEDNLYAGNSDVELANPHARDFKIWEKKEEGTKYGNSEHIKKSEGKRGKRVMGNLDLRGVVKRGWEDKNVRMWGKRGSVQSVIREVDKRGWEDKNVRMWGKRSELRFDEGNKRGWNNKKMKWWGKRGENDDVEEQKSGWRYKNLKMWGKRGKRDSNSKFNDNWGNNNSGESRWESKIFDLASNDKENTRMDDEYAEAGKNRNILEYDFDDVANKDDNDLNGNTGESVGLYNDIVPYYADWKGKNSKLSSQNVLHKQEAIPDLTTNMVSTMDENPKIRNFKMRNNIIDKDKDRIDWGIERGREKVPVSRPEGAYSTKKFGVENIRQKNALSIIEQKMIEEELRKIKELLKKKFQLVQFLKERKINQVTSDL